MTKGQLQTPGITPVGKALLIGGITITVFLTILHPATKERAKIADQWCQQKFGNQYKGLGNVNAIVDGGSHCVLKNNSWIKVPETKKIRQQVAAK